MKAVLLACLLGAGTASAQTMSDIEQLERYQRVIDAANKLKQIADEGAAKKKLDCLKAFGHAPMCECLTHNLPYIWTFSDYVAILTGTKEENGYSKMPPDRKSAYDKVFAVRDQCVKQAM